MSRALARVATLLPTEAASPTAWRAPNRPTARVWQILGRGRLAIALDTGDLDAAGRCVDELLADPVLGQLIASRYLSPAGRALTEAPA